jgi:PAS domain S-box-containing protein
VYLGYNGKFSNIHHLKYLQDSLKKTQLEVGLLIQDGESLVFQYNLDGSLSEISPSCAALLGYTPEELQQIPLQQLIHPEDYEDHFNPQMFYRYVDNYRTLTVRLRTAKQTYKWFDIQGTFLLDKAEEITGILFLARDVSERLRLTEKMELNNRFLENTESILVVTDKQRRIEWVNASFTRISGYTQEEVVGKKPSVFLQGAGTDPSVVKYMHDKLEAGESFECELLNYTKSGKPYWVHFRCEPLRNAHGEIEKYFAIEEDITERKERDRELMIAASFPKMNPNPILRISRSGEIIFQNEQASQLRNIVYEGKTYTLQELAQFIGGRITDRFVLPLVELNHNYFEMTCLSIPETTFINIYCNNITELTHATQRLQNNERKYRFLAENTKDLICLHNTRGQLIYTSPSSEKLLGYRTEELQGRNLTDICHPEDQPAFLSCMEKILSGHSELETVQLRLKTRSTPYLWFEMQLYPVLEEERISGAQSSSRDITPLKLQELRLKVNELKYRRLIDNIDLGYLEVDNGGKVNYVNDAFCRMTKYEQSELLEQNPENILLPLPEQRSEMKQHNEARRQGIAEVYQLQIRRKDGVIRTWLISGAPLYNEKGEIEGSAAIHWDISPMIEMEVMLHEKEVQRQRSILQASIRSEEKQKQTLGRELHDGLGQLLAYISLNMQLLLDKKIPPEQIVQQTKELLSNAITEVRQLSRTLIPVSLDNTKSLRDIITESLALYANLKGVRFEFSSYDERIDQRLDLDQKHMIFRIIQELTNNTIKYAEASLIQVSLQGRTRNCVIEYLDNGKGFSPRRVKKGVGFESIQTRIESYNGKLSIVSSPGKGVKITMVIPFIKTPRTVLKEENGE